MEPNAPQFPSTEGVVRDPTSWRSVPATNRVQPSVPFQDGHALVWWAKWPAVPRDQLHARLLAQQGNFLVGSIEFRLQADAGVWTIGHPTGRVSQGRLG